MRLYRRAKLALALVIAAVWLVVLMVAAPAKGVNPRPSWIPEQRRNAAVLRDVFGAHGADAVSVGWCESRLKTTARNGQYRGLLQLGRWERSIAARGRYRTARDQALAGLRYFRMTGSDWGAWTCRP